MQFEEYHHIHYGSEEGACPSSAEVIEDTEDFIQL